MITKLKTKIICMQIGAKKAVSQYFNKKQEEGFTTVELLIILAVICIIGLLWMKFKDIITEFFNKVMASVKKVSDAVPAA